ncbi:MAG: hypothetical protein ACRD1N_11265 [Terriglobia bacterium]
MPASYLLLALNGAKQLTAAGKWVHGLQPLKPAEIAISSDELLDAMLKTECDNVRIMNQVTRRLRFADGLIEDHRVMFRFAEQHERGGRQYLSQVVQSDFDRDRRMENAGVSDDPEEFISAGPWNRPRKRAFRQAFQQRACYGVAPARLNLGINQYVGVDRLHTSASIHQIEERIAVQQINARKLAGFPALKMKLIRPARLPSGQSLAKQVISHGLKCTALLGGLFLQFQ